MLLHHFRLYTDPQKSSLKAREEFKLPHSHSLGRLGPPLFAASSLSKVFHTTKEVPCQARFEAQHLYRALGSPVGLSRRQFNKRD